MDEKSAAAEKAEISVLESGVWGTVGPHSLKAAALLSEYAGSEYGLLCHSADAAYEAALRHFGAFAGEKVAVPEICRPSDALIPLVTGADVIFLPAPDGVLNAERIYEIPEDDLPVCAVADLTDRPDSLPLKEIRSACAERKIPLILNAGGLIGRKWNGQPPAALADAVIYSLGEGSAINAGGGGFLASNSADVFGGAFAWHNCGRSPGEAATIDISGIIGGDFRVTEWIAAMAETITETGDFAPPAPTVLVDMKSQPVFEKRRNHE